jgi:hypothetical protein
MALINDILPLVDHGHLSERIADNVNRIPRTFTFFSVRWRRAPWLRPDQANAIAAEVTPRDAKDDVRCQRCAIAS